MNSKIESVGMAVPPPPPPPPPQINGKGIENGRSQLLADIRKGATLKKGLNLNNSNHNELSTSDKSKKQTQDLLQAELTSTLKRRKPIVINEPPKYEYPTYDNNNVNVINKNDESTHSISANTTNIKKPLNVNAVLSVVSGIKTSDVQYDAKSLNALKTQSNDKPKISHGKPNFMINTKEIKPINGELENLKMRIKSPEIDETTKLQPSNFFTKTNNLISIYKSSAKPTIEPNSVESQVEKCKSIFLIKTQTNVDDNTKNSQKSQQKTDFISKFENIPTTKHTNLDQQLPNKKFTENFKKSSVDETTNGISFTNVANKKALFEKPNQTVLKFNRLKNTGHKSEIISKSASATPIGRHNTLNSPRIINETEHGVTKVALNKNPSFGSIGRPTLVAANDQIDHHFERTVHTINETTSNNNGKHETKKFQQKTIVSFSKDLHNAPNKYPEQIRVKKTLFTERPHAAIGPFQNIRFSIKTDGNVIPKAK